MKHELQNGGRIVRFRYTIGMILYSIRKDSPPYLIRAGENAIAPGIKYSLLSFFLGWWGIPMGPLYTPAVIYSNFMGDTDITYEFTARMKSEDARAAVRNFNPYEARGPLRHTGPPHHAEITAVPAQPAPLNREGRVPTALFLLAIVIAYFHLMLLYTLDNFIIIA